MKRDRFWKGPYRLGGRGDLMWVSTDNRFTLKRPLVDWQVTELSSGESVSSIDLNACMQWIGKR